VSVGTGGSPPFGPLFGGTSVVSGGAVSLRRELAALDNKRPEVGIGSSGRLHLFCLCYWSKGLILGLRLAPI
jgi:hypothetical protein